MGKEIEERGHVNVVFVACRIADPSQVPRFVQVFPKQDRPSKEKAPKPTPLISDTSRIKGEIERRGFFLSHYVRGTADEKGEVELLTFHFFRRLNSVSVEATTELFGRMTQGEHEVQIFSGTDTLTILLS